MLEKHRNENLIIAGDYNLVMEIHKDKRGCDGNHVNALNMLQSYCEQYMLVDAWRQSHPDDFRFTWYRLRPEPVFCRVGMILINYGLMSAIKNTDINPGFRSDNANVGVEMQTTPVKRGKGIWKFNVAHLHDPSFVENINRILDQAISQTIDIKAAQRWEYIKLELIQECQRWSCKLAKMKNKTVKDLYNKMQIINEQLQNTNSFTKMNILGEELKVVETQLKKEMQYKT